MKSIWPALVIPALSLLALSPEAHACGGCVVPPDVNTQVTGHRMILATSKTQTTLYDQIQYSGAPESFAWFLPIKGQVEIGLSADALFAMLSDRSQVVVSPPPLACAFSGKGAIAENAASDGEGGGGVYVPPDEDVNVIAKETVGPYETVQLQASTPDALASWLTGHGYAIPDDVKPVITAYQQEGFDFLAMKLVPGEGVNSMRPVRVSTPGAGLTLPLRMVAAGTGVVTPVLLHVIAEGRYEAVSRENLRVEPAAVLWSWEEGSSNYRQMRDQLFGNGGRDAWLTESADRLYKDSFVASVTAQINGNPGASGWGDPDNGVSEIDDAKGDLETLFAGMNTESVWMTRMYAELSRGALAQDLELGAAAEQTVVTRYIQAKIGIGTPPACPPGSGWSCALATGERDGTAFLLAATGLAAAVSFGRRRRAHGRR